jgi:RecB family exonuclease
MSDHLNVDLILAPAAGGKTSAVVELLREPRTGRAIALVPSREQQRALYRRMGGRRLARVVQFYQLAGIVLDRVGDAPELLGDTARFGLVRALLGGLRQERRLPAYAAVAHKRGFVAALAELLTDLGDAGIAPETFAAAVTSRDTELGEVYARYVAFQEQRGLADLPRRLALARDALMADQRPTTNDGQNQGATDYGLGGYELLVVDGFDQFTPVQLSLLAALARRIPRVAITLTLGERERPAQRRFARTYAELRRAFAPHPPTPSPTPGRGGEAGATPGRGGEAGATPGRGGEAGATPGRGGEAGFSVRVTKVDPDPGRCAAPLGHLEAHLFDLDEQARPASAEGAVTLIEAADREREVRAVLRRIKRLIDGGTPPGQIAVLFRDGAAYTALLREVAEEYGLPLDVAEGLPLDQAPPIAALLGLLRLPLDDYARRALIETLRSPYLDDRRPTTDDRPATENGRSIERPDEPRTENQEPQERHKDLYGGSSVSASAPASGAESTSSDDEPENPRTTTLPDSQFSIFNFQFAILGSRLDAIARYKGIAGGLARWRAALDALAAAPPAEPDDDFPPPVTPAEAAALLDALDRFRVWIAPPERATVAEYAAWVAERAVSLRLDTGPFAERDRQAVDRFGKLLHDLARTATLLAPPESDGESGSSAPLLGEGVEGWGGEALLTFRLFFDDLVDAAASARYRLRVDDGIAAMPVLAARGLGFDHVALLGLSEGEFPRPLAEPAIYRRAERRALREERGLPLPAPDPADERTIFYEALARARRGLILARTRLDESGNPLPRSPYLTALLELLGDVEMVHVPAGGVPAWDEAASPQERALALAEALYRPIAGEISRQGDKETRRADSIDSTSSLSPSLPVSLSSWVEALRTEYLAWDHIVRARAVEAGREGVGAYGPYEGAIDDAELAEEVGRRFGPDHRWSVTEFNNYITCPFRFAAAHVLRVEPRREAEEALDGGQRGQLYHAILARAGAQWRAARLALTPDNESAVLAALDLAAQQVLDAAPERMGFAPSPIWLWERDELRRRLRAALRGFIRGDKGEWQAFEPAAVEQTFGGRRGAPPLCVETPGGTALVQGRIDRVDQRADGALAVVDYKSGSAGRPAKDALEGRDLQLAVYVLAVEQVLAVGQQVERAAFFQIGSGRRGAELKGQQLREALQAAQERIAETIAAVRVADFRVRPRDKCPDFCEFEAICRRNLEKRKHQ